MSQKVHPRVFRIGTVMGWDSKWFSKRKLFPGLLKEDTGIRKFLVKILRESGIDSVEIERSGNNVTVIIRTAKPGFIIGRAGTGAEDLKKKVYDKFFKNKTVNLQLNIVEVPKIALSATIVAEQAAMDIEKRMPFRRVMKGVIERVQKAGAEGVKISMSGRLGGAEIARRETLAWGKIPLQNLRAYIVFSSATAFTLYGTIGIKVWIYRGEVFEEKNK